jgi:hypothetical protein
MRKIGNEESLAQKKKRNTLYISIFMLAVLVLGTVGYAFASYEGTSNNGQSQQSVGADGRFSVVFGGQTFYLTSSLEEVKNVSVNVSLTLNNYAGKPLYISSGNGAVLSETYQIFSKYSSRIQEACYGPCEKDLPEKTCSDNLLVWKDSEENRVYQEDNCVFIEGDLRAVDAFIYKLVGMR